MRRTMNRTGRMTHGTVKARPERSKNIPAVQGRRKRKSSKRKFGLPFGGFPPQRALSTDRTIRQSAGLGGPTKRLSGRMRKAGR